MFKAFSYVFICYVLSTFMYIVQIWTHPIMYLYTSHKTLCRVNPLHKEFTIQPTGALVLFPFIFRLSREKWNFIKDEGGCCPFLEDIYSLV